jgi:hypothetical protein
MTQEKRTKSSVVLRDFNLSNIALFVGLFAPAVFFINFIQLSDRVYFFLVWISVCLVLFIFGFDEVIYVEGDYLYIDYGFTRIGKGKHLEIKISSIKEIVENTSEKKVDSKTSIMRTSYIIKYISDEEVAAPLESVFSSGSFRDLLLNKNSEIKFLRTSLFR